MFNEQSQIVKTWVNLVKSESTHTRDSVPALFNLREVVYSILDAAEAVTEDELAI